MPAFSHPGMPVESWPGESTRTISPINPMIGIANIPKIIPSARSSRRLRCWCRGSAGSGAVPAPAVLPCHKGSPPLPIQLKSCIRIRRLKSKSWRLTALRAAQFQVAVRQDGGAYPGIYQFQCQGGTLMICIVRKSQVGRNFFAPIGDKHHRAQSELRPALEGCRNLHQRSACPQDRDRLAQPPAQARASSVNPRASGTLTQSQNPGESEDRGANNIRRCAPRK